MKLNDAALNQLRSKEISKEKFNLQLQNFEKGFPFAELERAASSNDGIFIHELSLQNELANEFMKALPNLNVLKFVPASGAASRMFKFLFEAFQATKEPNSKDYNTFFKGLEKFPFYNALSSDLKEMAQGSFEEKKEFLNTILSEEPFSFGKKPKGMLPFHQLKGEARLAIEEHFAESQFFCASQNHLKLHFTISPEHKEMFESQVEKLKLKYQNVFTNGMEVNFSEQLPRTDVVAVTEDNKPVETKEGFLFRPGGHGALIENLNNLDADLIFIKNIDNVLPPFFHKENGKFKQYMGGVLLKVTATLFLLQKEFSEKGFSVELLNKTKRFAKDLLGIVDHSLLNETTLGSFLFKPVRVCGMVKNEGEPGGGPFWVKQSSGEVTLQIVEKSQIDEENSNQIEILNKSTHFNPVDIVCAIKNYAGKNYNLLDFVDSNTGFITEKSYEGKTIKAQELPGLWNGAMANWHTIFVEVPLVTFNPVKTINDLLKPNHLKEN